MMVAGRGLGTRLPVTSREASREATPPVSDTKWTNLYLLHQYLHAGLLKLSLEPVATTGQMFVAI